MPDLEERGLFWWNDEPIPDRQFAPNSAVAGLLKIEQDGRIHLELDGILSTESGPFAVMEHQGKALEKYIQGILKGSGRWVLLIDVRGSGGQFRTNGISFQSFLAMHCLVSDSPFPPGNDEITGRTLEINLAGLEGWLRLGAIKVSRSQDVITTEYTKPEPAIYMVDDGTLTLSFGISGRVPLGRQTDSISIKEEAAVLYSLNEIAGLNALRERYGLLEDLFILLTDSHYRLDWPSIRNDNTDASIRWYFQRMTRGEAATAPRWHECWTSFPQLRATLGAIWSTWKKKREEFGPGVYLYFGTRRGVPLYTEHRFVNLIWGIEAFHRTKYPTKSSSSLQKKIDRIISNVSLKKDKTWLSGKLSHAHEPSLAERIFETFRSIPIGIDETALRLFSTACATFRNDISHFGGHRGGGSYADFVPRLERMSEALSTLYHCLLLNEVGVDGKILSWWVHEGFRSYQIKWSFVEVGLLPKDVLQPDSSTTIKPVQTTASFGQGPAGE